MAMGRSKGKGKNDKKDKDKKRGAKNLFRRKKFCRFTVEKIKQIDYKDVDLLKDFINENGKIIPARRDDLAVFVDEVLQEVDVLVVDLLDLLDRETTELLAPEQVLRTALFVLVLLVVLAFAFAASHCHLDLLD